MLEKTPAALGHLLDRVRPGMEKLVWAKDEVQAPEVITVQSEAFGDGAPIPVRFTADGEGAFPPLAWRDLPPAAAEVVLIVEDADSPTPIPLLHALAWGLPAGPVRLAQGALPSQAGPGSIDTVGLNSLRKRQWLAPDPPPGHGPHRYVFQVFAVGHPLKFEKPPEKHDLIEALRGHVLARGRLIGLYERKG
jgi:Raf kinase inhibitor-like YbhB/YbcL family protein